MVTGGWKSTGSFQFRRLRSDHVTNVTADGDANHSPALGGCFTVLSASALSLALPVERAHSNLAVPPTAVAGTASVFGRTFGALRIRPYPTLAGKARRYSRIWFSRLSGRLEFGRRRRTCSALPEVAPLKVKGNVHQADERWNLDQVPDDRCKGCAGVDSKDRHSDRDGEFEIVAGRRKRQGFRLRIIRPQLASHVERHQEHHGKINQQWNGDAHHVERQSHDVPTLQ